MKVYMVIIQTVINIMNIYITEQRVTKIMNIYMKIEWSHGRVYVTQYSNTDTRIFVRPNWCYIMENIITDTCKL
jgi:hypothetical protein